MLRKTCALWALALPIQAAASCGAAFCTVNTSWDAQGWTEPGWRADLRFEYLRQDQPMAGHDEVAFGRLSRHHDEIRTRNRNWLASLDYGLNEDWSFHAVLPFVDRSHSHIHNHEGAQLLDAWDFRELGDARVSARRRLYGAEDARPSASAAGVELGLKLPTGDTQVQNAGGELAERSLQPGTGTTDLLAGAYYAGLLPLRDLSWFAQGLVQLPLESHEGYRPGRRTTVDAGVRYAAGDRWSLMLQANALHRARDRGEEAEPEDSGGTHLFVSPGVGYAFTRAIQAYAFVQLPIYQYVNGVQLVADYAVVLGAGARF